MRIWGIMRISMVNCDSDISIINYAKEIIQGKNSHVMCMTDLLHVFARCGGPGQSKNSIHSLVVQVRKWHQ